MFDRYTLGNGLRIIGERLPQFRSVSTGLWIGAGSQYEAQSQGGVSHFIEHMLFKGSEKRSARQIAEVIDAVGGNLNAFTAKECTCFYCKVMDEDLPLSLDVLSDLLLRSRFDEAEMQKEKGVVIEEILMADDSPEDLVSEMIMEAYYGPQPLSRPILGTQETVSAFTRDGVLAYYNRLYRPDNCVLAVAGNYDWEKLKELAEKELGGWARPEGELPRFSVSPAAPGTLRKVKDIEQLHLSVAYPGVGQGSDALYPLSVLNTVFGGAMSSRLFQTIREEKGMAYSVYSYPSVYQDTGTLIVYAGTGAEKGDEVLELIYAEANKLVREGLSKEEFNQARQQLKGGYVLGMESSSSRMNALGRRLLLLNDTQSEEEAIQKIDAIDYDQVFELTRRCLSGTRALALVGREAESVRG